MISRSALLSALCVVAASAALNGCGSDSGVATTGPSGRLTQGPVIGATVFADRVSAGTRFVQEVGTEIGTTTDLTTGDFTLPSVPGYNYILVSKGGTDKLTGANAIQMIAPAGAANITPLTTLVALDTTGTVKAKLEALMPAGAHFDADISTTASPAIILVAKSIESMVAAMNKSIVDAATASSKTIDAAQQTAVQFQTLQAIASQLTTASTASLQSAASLSTVLQAAASTAATNIQNSNSNITIPTSTASAIAGSAVTGIATAMNLTGTAATTAITGGEAAVITATTKDSFVAATTSSVSTTGIVIPTSTPTNYTPPTIPVVTTPTVPGTTGATGGTTGGTGTTF